MFVKDNGIERDVILDVPPEIAYELLTSPTHIVQWWCDEADIEPRPGSTGALTWGSRATNQAVSVDVTVHEAVPGERFSFYWAAPAGERATAENAVLLTFQLDPIDDGTRVTVTEGGMDALGWDAAALDEYHTTHENGWTHHLAALKTYAHGVAANAS
jgi:uncharacterized protein YndB with AHSA1/START domain